MRKDEMGLDQQSRAFLGTPRSSDYKGTGPEGSDSREYQVGKQYLMAEAVAFSLPAQPTETHGETSSPSDQTSPRRLNPKFVEWLQGLPEGWTSAEPINSAALETWSSRSREHLACLFSLIGR